jgi:tRNA 2-thiouridine synthesizing protein E
MAHLDVGGRNIELNEKGYLVNFGDWSEKVAEALAKEEGISLEHCHWEAIRFMREFYSEYEVIPSPRNIIKAIGSKLTRGACTRKVVDELFPDGGCKQACRLAGLPQYYCHSC